LELDTIDGSWKYAWYDGKKIYENKGMKMKLEIELVIQGKRRSLIISKEEDKVSHIAFDI
jgi:hypothetical protein